MKKVKKSNLKKLSLSKKTISTLDPESSERIVGGVAAEPDTLTKFWTPTTCRTISTGTGCYSLTQCQTGCATC